LTSLHFRKSVSVEVDDEADLDCIPLLLRLRLRLHRLLQNLDQMCVISVANDDSIGKSYN